MLSFLFLQAITPTPPPVIHRSTMIAPAISVPSEGEAITVEVDATAGGEILWRGSPRVDLGGGSASFNRTVTQAPEPGCKATRYERGVQNSFSLNLNRFRRDNISTPTSVQVSWVRPTGCQGDLAQRTVQLSGSYDLARGRSVTIEGDAGLKVRLTVR